eukprot:233729-Chlamydomonas_euryale.AAC.1
MWSLSRFGHTPDEAWLEVFWDESYVLLREMEPEHFAYVLLREVWTQSTSLWMWGGVWGVQNDWMGDLVVEVVLTIFYPNGPHRGCLAACKPWVWVPRHLQSGCAGYTSFARGPLRRVL